MNSGFARFLKAVVAIVVLLVLINMVRGWLSEYRESPSDPSVETTRTPGPEIDDPDSEDADGGETSSESPQTLSVLIDGLNLRVKPDATSDAIRGLEKGEKLSVVSKTGDWYNVTTEKDETGFITDNPSYTAAPKKKK